MSGWPVSSQGLTPSFRRVAAKRQGEQRPGNPSRMGNYLDGPLDYAINDSNFSGGSGGLNR
jgi:hypothetical protein